MNKLTIAVLVAGAVTLSAFGAEAKGKKGRPHMCDQFTETTVQEDGVNVKVAICTDGAKPVVLTSYIVTTMKDSDGNPEKVAIGYR